VGFVVDKVALGQVFLRVLRFSPVNIIPSLPHSCHPPMKSAIALTMQHIIIPSVLSMGVISDLALGWNGGKK
jgi:hypothetical protein